MLIAHNTLFDGYSSSAGRVILLSCLVRGGQSICNSGEYSIKKAPTKNALLFTNFMDQKLFLSYMGRKLQVSSMLNLARKSQHHR
jgi:hypothetical protein